MRLIFMGYHNIGYVCLKALAEMCREFGDDLVAVVSHEDDPGENIWFASAPKLAVREYLPLYMPADPNDPAFVAAMARLQPDFIISCYYRHMLKPAFLELPRLGALNLHGSLLPRYRGRCPHNWVLINGETETGVTLHYMEPKADRGDIVAQQPVPIGLDDTAAKLLARMTVAAEDVIRQAYPLLRQGMAPRLPQDHSQASYFCGRRPQDGLINWQQSALQVYNLVRAVTQPYPGAFTYFGGRKLYIWWGQPMQAASAARHVPAAPGQVLAGIHGRGLMVAAGQGNFLIEEAQWEGEPACLGPMLATWGHLVGQILGGLS